MLSSLENIERTFAQIRADAAFDVDGQLLWGHFFIDPDQAKLRPVADELSAQGYRVVDLYPTDDESTYFLHVERVERHSPESLHDRNNQFNALAERLGIEYDGWDVGPSAQV